MTIYLFCDKEQKLCTLPCQHLWICQCKKHMYMALRFGVYHDFIVLQFTLPTFGVQCEQVYDFIMKYLQLLIRWN
jgi:hypothetical protein